MNAKPDAFAGPVGHLSAGVGNADDSVQKLPLHERPPLDLKPESDEERRHRVEIGDGDADMVEASYM